MKKLLFLGAAFAALSTAPALTANAEDMNFNRVASFPVNTNISADMDNLSESSSEIIAATADGNGLVYSDSPLGGIGFIDITDPASPKADGFVKMEGEPTSVAVLGGKVFVALNTSESYTNPSGRLVAIDMKSRTEVSSCDLGGQPDSVAISPDGSLLAVAIENERDEDLNDGEIPQMPAGYVTIFDMADGNADCGSMKKVDVTGLAAIAGDDPEPEFVDFNANNELAVTLQENNHIVIIDGKSGKVTSNFSAGSVDLKNVDVEEEGALTFDGTQDGRRREPDSVQWLDNDRIAIANEGDYKGGSRGFTIFSKDGTELYESGLSFEYEIARIGHYPEKRSGNKGVEPEGMEDATIDGTNYMFLLSERSSVVGVYKINAEGAPELKQILPSGIAPEGVIAIPSRGLVAVANEADLGKDGGARSHVTLYKLEEGKPAYPTIISAMDGDRPIGWGALSGLVADAEVPGKLYAVNDSFYSNQPTIFTIDATKSPAEITNALRVTRKGANAQLLDLEGITLDGKGGFWLASEGRTDKMVPHGLYHVNAKGEIKESVAFPPELLAVEKRFGSEGVTKIGDTLWIAIQREWGDDPAGQVKLVAYNTESKVWGAVRYPLEPKGAGWIGLSEIVAHGDYAYFLERDNQIGANARVKKIFRVPLAELKPAPLGEDLPVVSKEEVRDLLPDLTALNGYVQDKVEGLAIDATGEFYAVTDNDGVDDANGETIFMKLGKIDANM